MSSVQQARGYLSIGEVLALVQDEFPDTTISKIRFLESQGLIEPERTPSGYRKFSPSDVERLRFILREQKERFLPLKVIKDRLDGVESDDDDDDDHVATNGLAPAHAEPVADVPAAGVAPVVAAGGDDTPREPAPAQAEGTAAERLPAWMTAPRRPARRRDDGPDAGAPATTPSPPPAITGSPGVAVGSGGAVQGGVSFTFDELAGATGLTPEQLAEVERYGLIKGTPVGRLTYYEEDAFVVASLAARFLRHGVEARHLKAFRNAAEREAGLYEQVVLPLVKQRNPVARAQARATLEDLEHLGAELHRALLREQLRAYTDGR